MSADGEQGGVRASEDDHLIGLLRREGRHSGVWFGHHLLTAADRLEGLTPTPATDKPEVVRKAVNLAYDLLIEVEQTTNNVWWVNVDDPEVAVSDTLDALEDARTALAKHPTSPEDTA